MTSADIAAKHGGTAVHCQHSDVTFCSRCPVPLHVAGDDRMAYQFSDAASLVAFVRENGAVSAQRTREAFLAGRR